MAFDETAPIWIAVPVGLVILVAISVFMFGFRSAPNPPTFQSFEKLEDGNGKKKKKKGKKSTTIGSDGAQTEEVKKVEPTSSGKSKKDLPTESKSKKSVPILEAKPKKVVPTPEAKPKKVKNAKKVEVVEKEEKPVAAEMQEATGDWLMAKSRKRPQPKGKSDSAPPSPNPAVVVAVEKAESEQKPDDVGEKASKKKKNKKAEPVQEVVVVSEQPPSAEVVPKQDDEGSSPAHSVTTGSSLSESWVSPDEMRSALKEFDTALSSQASGAESGPSPSAATKKKKKKNKASKNTNDDSGMGSGAGSPIVEEPMTICTSSTPLGDRGNPYRDVAMDAEALAVVAEELAVPTEKAEAVKSSKSGKKKAKAVAPAEVVPKVKAVAPTEPVPSAEPIAAAKTEAKVEATATPAFDELGEQWEEAKVKPKQKKQRVRRDN